MKSIKSVLRKTGMYMKVSAINVILLRYEMIGTIK